MLMAPRYIVLPQHAATACYETHNETKADFDRAYAEALDASKRSSDLGDMRRYYLYHVGPDGRRTIIGRASNGMWYWG